ncbi:MAG: hypothetical protein KBT50_01700 [Cycloclasticus sp.]|nr:hypothetical protein [Cycloclasticus sp.]MBQ0789304.1 hypothetical protein [Cycloclasticus sp.]
MHIKTMLLTVSVTSIIIFLSVWLFLNSLLATFGLAATSIHTLKNLYASQSVVNQMKQRHQVKKRNLTTAFTKRSAKKIASTALAAATIGTVAVAITMVSLEVSDYCEQKKSLHEDETILYATDSTFDFDQCIHDGQEDSKRLWQQVMESTNNSVNQALNAPIELSDQAWLGIKQAFQRAINTTNQASNDLWESTQHWLSR